MLTWVMTLGLSLFLLSAPILAADLDPALTKYLPPLIRAQNMRCDTLSRITLRQRAERGDVFQVICDEHTAFYRYRLTYTPDGKMYIKPWSE